MLILEWAPGVHFKPGDIVSYQGRNYRSIQGHTSQIDWAPPMTPALWGDQGHSSSYGSMPGMPSPIANQYDSPAWVPPVPPIGRRSSPILFPGMAPSPQYDNRPGPSQPFSPPSLPAPADQFPAAYQPPIPMPKTRDVPTPFGNPSHESMRYQSSAEWIEDAKRRARELSMWGPKKSVDWLLAEPAGNIPRGAIQAGQASDGAPLYIARNFHEGGMHIGWATRNGAGLSWGGAEIPLTTYEVLTGDVNSVSWVPSGSVGKGTPVEGGYEADGKPLWAAQVCFGRAVLTGKTAGWDTGAYVGIEGSEHQIGEYNVLVEN